MTTDNRRAAYRYVAELLTDELREHTPGPELVDELVRIRDAMAAAGAIGSSRFAGEVAAGTRCEHERRWEDNCSSCGRVGRSADAGATSDGLTR